MQPKNKEIRHLKNEITLRNYLKYVIYLYIHYFCQNDGMETS